MVSEIFNFLVEDNLRAFSFLVILVFIFSLGFILGDMIMNRYDRMKTPPSQKTLGTTRPAAPDTLETFELVDWQQKTREGFPNRIYIVLRILTNQGEVSYFKLYDLQDQETNYPWRISLTGEKAPHKISDKLDDLNAKRDFLEVLSDH